MIDEPSKQVTLATARDDLAEVLTASEGSGAGISQLQKMVFTRTCTNVIAL